MFEFLFRRSRKPAPQNPRAAKPRPEDKWDGEFADYRRAQPTATFAEFYVAKAMETINRGEAHPTLGGKLNHNRADRGPDGEFRSIARPTFKRYQKIFQLAPDRRVVDYGCGSLRVGVHWIEFLDPGNYMGLDVTRDFIDMGVPLIGEALIAEKESRFAAICEASVAEAAAFGPDLVFSHAVAYHVHPDEFAAYAANLVRIANRPGARLAVNVMIANSQVRYRKRGWAYPLDYYVDAFSPLALAATHLRAPIEDARSRAYAMDSAILEFHRD